MGQDGGVESQGTFALDRRVQLLWQAYPRSSLFLQHKACSQSGRASPLSAAVGDEEAVRGQWDLLDGVLPSWRRCVHSVHEGYAANGGSGHHQHRQGS